jgi:multisubunit Na+/H+ antiporter MnhF subunit
MTPIAEPASRRVRLVASVLWRALAAVAGLHAYWLLGGTWAVHAASGGSYSEVTTGLRVQAAVLTIVLVLGCLVVRARAGLWRPPVSDRVVGIAMWALTIVLALAALQNCTASTNVERFAIAPFVLVLAILAFVVAWSGHSLHGIHRPHRPQPSH